MLAAEDIGFKTTVHQDCSHFSPLSPWPSNVERTCAVSRSPLADAIDDQRFAIGRFDGLVARQLGCCVQRRINPRQFSPHDGRAFPDPDLAGQKSVVPRVRIGRARASHASGRLPLVAVLERGDGTASSRITSGHDRPCRRAVYRNLLRATRTGIGASNQ